MTDNARKQRNRLRYLFSALVLLASVICHPSSSYAGLIRDAEIEATLRSYADPIFKAAGLKPSAVKIYLVQDRTLNAFVAGGSNLFIHTGLITETESADMLLGVIAHETGHIAGGHLAKGSEKLKDAQIGTIIATVLGAGAAVATGKPEAAAAVITGTSTASMRNFFSFTRANENAADQAALGYLDKLNISSYGMVKMFELLKRQERKQFGVPDPYLRTHPLTNDRIDHVRAHVEQSLIPEGSYPKELSVEHQRMVAKLRGFMDAPEKTLRTYGINDQSIPARMARAIAFFRQSQIAQAETLMDGLVKENPNDAFLYDLRGQILFESAKPAEALASYRSANKLLPSNALIMIDLGKSEMTQGSPENITSAVAHLERATTLEPFNSFGWRQLATAYSKQHNEPMSHLALSEEALLDGDVAQTIAQSDLAINSLTNASAKLRAQDIKTRALQMQKEQADAKSIF